MAADLLSLAGPGARETGWRSNLIWFRVLVLTHMAARSMLLMPMHAGADFAEQAIRGAIVLTAVVGLIPNFSLWATRVAALLLVVDVIHGLPYTANHVFMEFLLLAFLALLDEHDEREAPLLLQALRWLIAVMFFYTGLQKLLYGYYFDGQFLAYMAATEDRFTAFFRHLIPADEMQRLQAFNEGRAASDVWRPAFGAGPYRVHAPVFVAMSNFVYLFEMSAGILLLVARTRIYAAVASIAFVIMIELAARELTFGALMINLLLLFLPGQWVKWLYPAFAAFYLYLVLADVGAKAGHAILPMFPYSPP